MNPHRSLVRHQILFSHIFPTPGCLLVCTIIVHPQNQYTAEGQILFIRIICQLMLQQRKQRAHEWTVQRLCTPTRGRFDPLHHGPESTEAAKIKNRFSRNLLPIPPNSSI